jgi:hypothetical protein
MATQNPLTDVIAVFLIFLICINLITYEKEKKLFTLLRPTYRGRTETIVAKTGVLCISCFTVELVLYATNFALAGWLYGFGSLGRYIQSVLGFLGCNLSITVRQYFVIYLISKYAAYLIMGLLILACCAALKKPVAVYLSAAGMALVSFVLYDKVASTSAFNFFKYINPVSFILTTPIFISYININLFGYPESVVPAFFITAAIAGIVLAVSVIILFNRQKPVETDRIHVRVIGTKFRIPVNCENVSLLYHEAWKILFTNRALVVLLAFIAFQVYLFHQYRHGLTIDDLYYKDYMITLQGELNDQKDEFIRLEKEKFDGISAKLIDLTKEYNNNAISDTEYRARLQLLMQSLKPANAFNRVVERYNYIKNYDGSGRKPWFVYDLGYNRLTAGTGIIDDILLGIKLLVAMIACLSPVFAIEYSAKAIQIISTCRNGRGKIVAVKIAVSMGLTLVALLIIYIPEFLAVRKYYGFPGLDAPINSLVHFSDFHGDITILEYLVLLNVIRILGAVCASFIILSISVASKSTVKAILLSTGAVALPILLSPFGVALLEPLTLAPLLSCNMIFTNYHSTLKQLLGTRFYSALCIILPLTVAAAAFIPAYRRFCHVRPRKKRYLSTANG